LQPFYRNIKRMEELKKNSADGDEKEKDEIIKDEL
jgi:hypothetical protein